MEVAKRFELFPLWPLIRSTSVLDPIRRGCLKLAFDCARGNAIIRSRETRCTPTQAHRKSQHPVAFMSTGPIDAGARFTVVIVNYNGGAMLLDCVQSAVAEHVPASQIVVVDNGSTDHSIDSLAAAFPSINIILNSCNEGFARAVNRGLRIATGEFALLLNNDARLEPGALQAFADGFGRFPKLAIAGGQLRYPDGRLQSAFAPLPSLAEELLPRPILKLLWPRRFQRKALLNLPGPSRAYWAPASVCEPQSSRGSDFWTRTISSSSKRWSGASAPVRWARKSTICRQREPCMVGDKPPTVFAVRRAWSINAPS